MAVILSTANSAQSLDRSTSQSATAIGRKHVPATANWRVVDSTDLTRSVGRVRSLFLSNEIHLNPTHDGGNIGGKIQELSINSCLD